MIVLDASLLIGYYNERDSHHQAAKTLMERFLGGEWGRGLILEYAFLEVVNVLLVRRDLAKSIDSAQRLLRAPEVEFVPCSGLFGQTLEIFRAQSGTRLSFTDSAIVAVARKRTNGLVATFDAEFRKIAGITVVPA